MPHAQACVGFTMGMGMALWVWSQRPYIHCPQPLNHTACGRTCSTSPVVGRAVGSELQHCTASAQ